MAEQDPPPSAAASLDDKYTTQRRPRVSSPATQALVRLPMLQRERDQAAGLNTAGFVSGYRGSPAGRARSQPVEGQGSTWPSTTSCSSPGSTKTWPPPRCGAASRSASVPGARYEGVFGHVVRQGAGGGSLRRRVPPRQRRRHRAAWRRAGDRRRRPRGQVVHPAAPDRPRLQGDDDAGAHPASVQEYLDFGLHGWAMSPLLGLLGGLQGAGRHGRNLGLGRRRPDARRYSSTRPTSRCRPTASTSAGPTRRWCRKPACSTTSSTPRWPTAGPTGSTGW